MKNRSSLIITLLLFLAISACSVATNNETIPFIGIENSTTVSGVATDSVNEAMSAATLQVGNSATLSEIQDYQWDDLAVIPIIMNDLLITSQDESIKVDGSRATITTAGTYSLTGSLRDGQIIVDTQETGMVRIVLNGVAIHNSSGAPIYIKDAEKAMIVLADNTQNLLSDGTSYLLETGMDEPNATLFSKADLVIYGNGALTVQANYNDGIASKDGLLINSGTITITVIDDGMRGKDYLVITGGNITINAGGDGLKSSEADDAELGYISIEGGSIKIVSAGDGLDAETNILISGGELNLTSGGGYTGQINNDVSAKGIKANAAILIEGGDLNINSADDTIHSNGSIIINNGNFNLTTGDDGIHADASLTINGGNIRIGQSYEGIESASIIINAGNLHIIARDDAINVAGGMDGSGLDQRMPGGRPRLGGGTPPHMDGFAASSNYTLSIHGGYIVIDAGGDGIDVNGRIDMTDGLVIVHGPTESMNSALDYDEAFNISGGFLIAVGSAGMAQAPDETSSQNSLLINFSTVQTAGTLIQLRSSDGEELFTFEPSKSYQSIAFSSPQLNAGTNYQIFLGGSAAGTSQDGLHANGSDYTLGQQYTEIMITNTVTRIGSGGNPRRP